MMLLQEAIDLIKSDQKEKAYKILIEIVRQEPSNENAWLWLATCVNSNDRKIYCLQKAIEINPENRNARLALEKITSSQPSLEDITGQKTLDHSVESSVFSAQTAAKIANVALQNKSAIEFIAAKCPNCGGELRIPENLDKAKCTYCGYDIVIHNASRIQVETKVDINKLLGLAKIAEDGGNFAEAYSFYTQVIEYDSKNVRAWIGKGYSAGLQSTREKHRYQETISCLNQALTIGISNVETGQVAGLRICDVALLYFSIIAQQCNDYLAQVEAQQRNVGLGGLILQSIMNNARSKVSPVFTQEHAPTMVRLFTIAWDIQPDLATAEKIYAFINAVRASYFVSESDTQTVLGWTAGLQKKIRDILPNWKPPEVKKKNRPDCFIATATMGDDNHPFVQELRYFRENTLRHSRLGRVFINCYYQCSPPLASLIKRNKALRRVSLELLIKPAVTIAKLNRRSQ